jgi:hypothetical protein
LQYRMEILFLHVALEEEVLINALLVHLRRVEAYLMWEGVLSLSWISWMPSTFSRRKVRTMLLIDSPTSVCSELTSNFSSPDE